MKQDQNSPLKGMWRDSLKSLQPEGTYPYALNAQKETFDARAFGLVNEPSNEICFDLDEVTGTKWIILGGDFIEERDLFLFFAREKGQNRSIIGTLSTTTCKSEILIDDEKWEDKLCFGEFEYIPVVGKSQQPCNHLVVYFSAGNWYYRLDVDGDLCNLERKDLLLLQCPCPPRVDARVVPSGGELLQNGAYQFVLQLIDDDGNTTNWFKFSNPVYVYSETNKAGDISPQSIELTIDGISNSDWGKVNIGVLKTIGGQESFHLLSTQPYTSNGTTFRYVGGEEGEPRDIAEVFARQNRYIRGKNLVQKESRLILFQLTSEWNLDYQRQANNITVDYGVFKVKASEACDYKSLMRDEVYSLGIKWNYCDGTSSAVFHIPGRDATEYDREIIESSDDKNCTDCDLQRWQIENTAARTELFCPEPYSTSAATAARKLTIEQERRVEYVPTTQAQVDECCGKEEQCTDPCKEGCSGSSCSGGCSGGSCSGDNSGPDNCQSGANGTVCYGCETGFNFTGYDGQFVDLFWKNAGISSTDLPVGNLQGSFIHDPEFASEDTLTIVFRDADGNSTDQVELSYNCAGEAQGSTSGETAQGCSGGGCGGGSSSSGGSCKDGNCTGCGEIVKGFICKDEDGNDKFEPDENGELFEKKYIAPVYSREPQAAAANETQGCEPEPIFDESGCNIIGYTKPLVAKGTLSYWESYETYPETLNCEDKRLYGDLAGCPIRHHKMPCEILEPHFLSEQLGVPNPEDPANDIQEDTFVYLLGLIPSRIEKPENPPKPLCEENPFDIMYQKRDQKNRSVVAKGLFTGTFKGEIDGREFLVPKNGVNSLEYFDGSLSTESDVGVGSENIASKKHRGGWNADVAAYNFHSPDTCFDEPFVGSVSKAKVSWELFGEGYRFGQYAKGVENINEIWLGRENQRGARQWVNLNQYKCAKGNEFDPCCVPARITLEQQTGWLEGQTVRVSPFRLNVNFGFGGLTGTYTLKTELGVQTAGEKTEQIPTSGIAFETSWFKDVLDPFSSQLEYQDIISTTLTFDAVSVDGCRYSGVVFIETIVEEDGTTRTVTQNISSPDCDPENKDNCRGLLRCVKGISYAFAGKNVKKGDEFTYPLLNEHREHSVYLEFEDTEKLALTDEGALIDSKLNDNRYNGLPDKASDLVADRTSDASFLGDVFIQECPIFKAGGWYGSLKRENIKQYGRLESAPYITLYQGTDDDATCGKAILSDVGDVYITQYSFVRHSLVSDKIGSRGQQRNESGFSNEVLCDYKCGNVPRSGDNGERKNEVRLRGFDGSGNEDDRTVGDRCWDGEQEFQGLIGRDTFRPNLQKTMISFWVESEINTCRRQRGDESKCEVSYPNLGGLELDSNFPRGWNWREALLNCHYVEQNEAAGWKLFARTLFAILTVVAGFISTVITGSNFLCRLFDWLFNLDECRPECLDGFDDCMVDLGKIKGKPLNYCVYSFDYSKVNEIEPFFGASDPYDTCICEDESTRIVYSDKQNPESHIDSYRNFKVNNYSELPTEYGRIKDFFNVGNRFYAHTSDMVLYTRNDDESLVTADGQTILLGRGTFLQRAEPIQAGMSEGYAGTLDPNSSMTCQYGHFFVDREARKVFQFSPNGLIAISDRGMRNFFKENLDIKLLKHFPDYPHVDTRGVGYKIGYDHRFDRVILTKEDYEPLPNQELTYFEGKHFKTKTGNTVELGDEKYFCNKSFTISYDPKEQMWVSFHSYVPRGYVWDRDHLYSYLDGQIWKHGDRRGHYQTFYGDYQQHVVEVVVRAGDGQAFDFKHAEIDTEARTWVECQSVEDLEFTFNKGVFSTSNQSTGEVNLVPKLGTNKLADMQTSVSEIKIQKWNKLWRINGMKNRVIDPTKPIFDCSCEPSQFQKVNQENILQLEQQSNTKKFEDRFISFYLILDAVEDLDKEVITKLVRIVDDVNT